MESKALYTIQVLAKIGKILSKIAFICCIVTFCICLVSLISMAIGADTLKIGGVTLETLLIEKGTISLGTIYASTAAGMILCAGEAVLAKFAECYFKRELAVGTPFTFDGAKEMLRLGILTICIPLSTQIIAEIIHAILANTMEQVAELNLSNGSSVALGVMFMILSVFCRYGTEIQQKNA